MIDRSRRVRVFIAMMITFPCLSMRLAAAEGPYGRAVDNKIFAQTLVNAIKAENPDLLAAGMHAAAPGAFTYSIIASTMDIIGKRSDDNDVDVAVEGRTHLTPNASKGKIGIMMPLNDSAGHLVGALGLAFRYREGENQAVLFARATSIRDKAAQRVAAHDALFATSH